ncbi:MAG: tol-pal system protein YbgF [Rhizobiales bacterium]|nr:tol-pal system protein YbgF [Hyphomicrobiales bacterium]
MAAGLSVVSTVTLAQDGPFNPLDRLFGNRPSADVEQPREQGPTTEQVLRIEQLEAKIRQMTGTIEQLQYRNQQLETQIRSMGGNAASGQPMPGAPQQAMQPQPPMSQPPMQRPAMEAQPMRPMQQQGAVSPSSPPPSSGRRADVFDPSQNPSAPGSPRPLGSMPVEPPPPVVTADTPVGAPGGRGAGAPLDLSTMSGPRGSSPSPSSPGGGLLPAPPSRNPSATGAVASVAPPSESPQGFYDLGYGYVLRKDYALAEQAFQQFLSKYPNDRRAPDAQFWLGESQFQRQQYDAAAQSFLDVSTKHGTHAKAPEALLRLAQSLAALKQKEMSCATLAEVGRKYPKAPTSVKQAVEREQKRVQC